MYESFRDLLFSGTDIGVYAIADGASCDTLLEKLREFSPEHCCLYAGKLGAEVAQIAPYLISLEEGHSFTHWFLEEAWNQPIGIFLWSVARFKTLRKHFRTFLLVKDPTGSILYFRYYDPRVLSVYLPTTNHDELRHVFREVHSYYCPIERTVTAYEVVAGQLQTRTYPCEPDAGQ